MCLFSTGENTPECSHISAQDLNFPTSALTSLSWFGNTSFREVTVPQKKKCLSTWSSLQVISYWDTDLKFTSAAQEEHCKHSVSEAKCIKPDQHSSPHRCQWARTSTLAAKVISWNVQQLVPCRQPVSESSTVTETSLLRSPGLGEIQWSPAEFCSCTGH